MALNVFTASTDYASKGRRLVGWHVSQGAGAQTINLRNGGSGGTIYMQIQVPATSSSGQFYGPNGGPYFPAGLYVEVVGTGFAVGSVDLV